jgi:FKBP-type peptidyl-prolyl cis-trans isomerase
MIKSLTTLLFASFCFSLFAQTSKPPVTAKPPVSKTAQPTQPVKPVQPAQPMLKNMNDSASYAIGISVANFYKSMGITHLNGSLVSQAIADVLGNKKTLITDQEVNAVMNSYMTKMEREKSKPTIEAGENFLAENKKRPNVITTASGLQYEIIKQGDGPVPGLNDQVTCHYEGKFINGVDFDNSVKRNKPETFSVSGVIKGWTEALQMMPQGSKWKLFVPYQLGYGAGDYSNIPGGSVLVFDVELLEVKK